MSTLHWVATAHRDLLSQAERYRVKPFDFSQFLYLRQSHHCLGQYIPEEPRRLEALLRMTGLFSDSSVNISVNTLVIVVIMTLN